jgi:undecaprenyl-diphosphatase
MANNFDYWVLQQLNHWVASSTFLSSQAIFLNDSGFSELLIASSIVALWFSENSKTARPIKKNRHRVLLMVFALVPTYILARLIQSIFHRPRPMITVPLEIPKNLESWNSVRNVFSHWGSFPSDHEALLFIFITVAFTIDKRLGIISFFFSIYYGLLRISFGYLWPSDVIGGALLGFFVTLSILSIKALLKNVLEYLLLQFKRYPAKLYTISFLLLSDFSQSFSYLKKIFSLVFHYRLFH